MADGRTGPLETLVVERAEGIVTVRLDRPEKKNAISARMWDELEATLAEIGASRDDRVLVLAGTGDAFCAGQDLTDPENNARFTGVGNTLRAMRRIGGIALALHQLTIPTVAAVNGVAAGAGANLALGCDITIAAASARFSQIFAKRGLTVDFGGTWLLPRLIGLHRAKELAFTADIIDAAYAERIGLVNRVVPDAELTGEAQALATRLAAMAPLAISSIKRQFDESAGLSMAQALEAEAEAQAMLFASSDVTEAMAAFVEKREPQFRGD